jgi:PadR family transcriptional regulator AphA
MLPAEEPALSRSEWIVLSLVREGPTHGNAVSRLVGPDGDLGLIASAGEEPSPQGPVRLLVEATEAGRAAAVAWQHRPVKHTRDIRSELLVKLALLHRSNADPHDLLVAQQALLVPVAGALRDRMATATGFDRTLLLWRYETVSATVRFLDALLLSAP